MATTPDPAAVAAYLAAVDPRERAALETVIAQLMGLLPTAEQRVTYGIITFRVTGKDLVGVGASKAHLGFYAMSSTLLHEMTDELAGWPVSGKGTLRFTAEQPLPPAVVDAVVTARLRDIGQ